MSDLLAGLIPGLKAPAAPGYHLGVEGRVLRNVASAKDGMYFVITAFDGETHEWGPAPWGPERTFQYSDPDGNTVLDWLLPLSGDRVLVHFPGGSTDNPWVVDWWPVGRGYEETRV